MARLILMDLKERENAICKRCGETRSVKYKIGEKTYCNRCAPLITFNSNDHEDENDYDDNFDMNYNI